MYEIICIVFYSHLYSKSVVTSVAWRLEAFLLIVWQLVRCFSCLKKKKKKSQVVTMATSPNGVPCLCQMGLHYVPWKLTLDLFYFQGEFISMGVYSSGNSYGVPDDLIYSFPVTIKVRLYVLITRTLKHILLSESELFLMAKYIYTYRKLSWWLVHRT